MSHLAERRWYRIWVTFDAEAGELALGQAPLDLALHGDDSAASNLTAPAAAGLPGGAPLHIAALGGTPVSGHFNGKIERPQIFSRALDPKEIEAVARGEETEGRLAHWDFSRGISSTAMTLPPFSS